jgi:hypothetical protein
LQPGGVLALVIPGNRLVHCSDVLAAHFGSLGVYRLTDSQSSRYSQVVVFGVRRSRQERERARDRDVLNARQHLCEAASGYRTIEPMQDQAGRVWHVPPARKPATLTYRGLPLDSIEDALPTSRAYRQAERLLFAPETQVRGRPLTPLHPGHASILACSGLLNGVFGKGEFRHAACSQSGKENVINYTRWVGWLPTLSGDPSLSPAVRS